MKDHGRDKMKNIILRLLWGMFIIALWIRSFFFYILKKGNNDEA